MISREHKADALFSKR